jgi:hypothetical protein
LYIRSERKRERERTNIVAHMKDREFNQTFLHFEAHHAFTREKLTNT